MLSGTYHIITVLKHDFPHMHGHLQGTDANRITGSQNHTYLQVSINTFVVHPIVHERSLPYPIISQLNRVSK